MQKQFDELVIYKCKSCDLTECVGNEKCKRKYVMSPPQFFDGGYINLRNSFVDDAENHANKTCGKTHGKNKNDEWAAAWNLAFHTKMGELVAGFYREAADQWIIGSDACRAYLNMGSWSSARRWVHSYGAPLRHWVDGRPVFLKSEIDKFLKESKQKRAAA